MSLTPLYVITGAAFASWVTHRFHVRARNERDLIREARKTLAIEQPTSLSAQPPPKAVEGPRPLRPKVLPPMRYTLVAWQRFDSGPFNWELDLIDEKHRETLTVRGSGGGLSYLDGTCLDIYDRIDILPIMKTIIWGMHEDKRKVIELPPTPPTEDIKLDPLPDDMVENLLSKEPPP